MTNIQKENTSFITSVSQLNSNIVRVTYEATPTKEDSKNSILIANDFKAQKKSTSQNFEVLKNGINFKNKIGEIILKETEHRFIEKKVSKYVVDGEPVYRRFQTADGEKTFIVNSRMEPAGTSFKGKLVFSVSENEAVYGLGQHEDGIYNYNGKTQYLFQTNMKISIPFIISSKNYGILIDTECAMIFDCNHGHMSFLIDTTNRLSYYVIIGENFDEIIRELRNLTGRAPMLPRWAYGYIQSKERYHSAQELHDTVQNFRQSGIPIDCIVQDWRTWEDGLHGEKRPDKKRYPDLKGLINSLHEQHVKLMVSIWPSMGEDSLNYQELKESGNLLPFSSIYNAYSEEARAIYWRQCEEEWFSAGVDAWWCDGVEPFSDEDWKGEEKKPDNLRYKLILNESKKFIDWTQMNSYSLFHSKGLYENWRKEDSDKRVTILTRSSYASDQRYGTIPWSGDVSAKWSELKKQITEGINFSLSGMPYWNCDIGAYFTVKDKYENRGCDCHETTNKLWYWDGDFNDGTEDFGYRELYVRWLQYGVFLPMFRSHGTDTSREPWNFGGPGEMFYDAILKYIHLRYRLLPYIYSWASQIHHTHATILRSLMFDFPEDENVKNRSDSFMFGKGILVCPVTEPMYYAEENRKLFDTVKKKNVYLPKGTRWFDFWSTSVFEGGKIVTCNAPLDIIPLFVRSGSIIPMSDPISYADEKKGTVSEIMIYGGANGEFVLYNDEGNNYSYENGNYSMVPIRYDDSKKTITFERAFGGYQFQKQFKITIIDIDGNRFTGSFPYAGEKKTLSINDLFQ